MSASVSGASGAYGISVIRASSAGLKWRDSAGRTAARIASGSGRAPRAAMSAMMSAPRFDVRKITVFAKSTSLPSPSDSEPLSNTW
ncbi:Uncharacterised protein [Burkholderia pseudomallei]|nr:Uncharacterised protein [Burkholderia pseudomallei]VBE08732.1 Uncharacterised protein [Burkholderia pseudomallei]VBH23832.1 Uncharacterised protein [Burkholderia pseudomallei]VBM13432.1 Uncharacterised protein [Burkholderia pseudomallei]VBM35872.1 Uncharacterised protein [Burkholderia pseudomallei]